MPNVPDEWVVDNDFSSFYQREESEDAAQEAKVTLPISVEHYNVLAREHNAGVDFENLSDNAPFVDKFKKSAADRGL